uniref:RRM domain-containing protein n=1 Tax=Acrobeloides nanus TaxID=290746 RepID=A0A914DXC1_9BILA
MDSKAPKQTFESNLVVIQPKSGQNKQSNDFSQSSYIRSPSTSSTIASNYSSPSTTSSYADKINSLCVERNRKKLLLEKHYLTQQNKEAESKIPSLEEEISVLEPLATLVAFEQEYRFGKFTTIRREEEVVREIGKLKYQIPRLPHWSKKFNEVQDPSEAIRQHISEKRYLEKRTKSNQELLKKIQQVLTQISNEANIFKKVSQDNTSLSKTPEKTTPIVAQSYATKVAQPSQENPINTYQASAQVKPSAQPQQVESSAQSPQSSPPRPQQDDRLTIKVTHLPQDMEISQLEQELFGIFGDADTLGSTLSHPIQRLYVTLSRHAAFITYFKREDAETAVERLCECHLRYQILRVDFASRRSDNA